MSRLALPYDRFAPRRAPPWLRQKTSQAFHKPDGVESEPSSDFSSDVTSDVTSDFTDVTSDVTDFSSVSPSEGALKDIEQGTLGAVVGGPERRTLGSAPPSLCGFLSSSLLPNDSSSVVSEAQIQT